VAGQVAGMLATFALGFVGPRWPEGVDATFVVLGVCLIALGTAALVAGGAFLGTSLTPYPRPKADGTLREDGVYGIVRHPMYGGGILMTIGWSLASRPLALVGAVLLGLYLDRKSAREERWLVEHYDAYEVYRRRTRWKLLPFLR
jgi:protein-S-isoprenylcysteine O-methyltransferase Ste14